MINNSKINLTRPACALLAIGTEITTGQITDTNSGWIANRLTDLNYDVRIHLSVPDTMDGMIGGLTYASKQAELVIVTGGLGPTKDDFTREAVSRWSGLPLIYDESSWNSIVELMASYSTIPPESNRIQCWFPEGAVIHSNSVGTANGFEITHMGTTVICLPGPPRENQWIFNNHLARRLSAKGDDSERVNLLKWHTLGIAEASLGDMVEQVIDGSTLTSGYRPHLPYVEVKIWCPDRDQAINAPYLKRLNETLAPWTISRDDEDILAVFMDRIKQLRQLTINDYITRGALLERIRPALPEWLELTLTSYCVDNSPLIVTNSAEVLFPLLSAPATLTLTRAKKESHFVLCIEQENRRHLHEIPWPFPAKAMTLRRTMAYGAELAIIYLARHLPHQVNIDSHD